MSVPGPSLRVLLGAATHIGGRRRNADAFDFTSDSATGRGCWAVADGIGDRTAVAAAAQHAAKVATAAGAREGAQAGLLAAATALADPVAEWPENNCVMVVAAREPGGRIGIAWTGDARCYRFDGTELALLTADHTVGQRMRESGQQGQVAEAEEFDHIVTTTVGTAHRDGHGSADTSDDFTALLLCSDGIGKVLSHQHITALLTEFASNPQTCADRLVADAVAAAGKKADNATALVVIREHL
ncbi:serine/threonine protein phosphatase [Crossiella sp. SN42]|uniref:PP2C family protein-serine/threonine phosphatase n=1 Tax=Crossiella sp. SN42 TaxID=2944808 RepID=UPI00207C3B54|nr:serine/threonine protein phosphatase [Crossiella sp. SN42]MCO1575353.1 serine/threonine protein phosphatase [Crossiella sp. SN42]